jgi:hypothetical protein
LNKIKNKHAQKQCKLKPTLNFFASLRAILKNKIDRYKLVNETKEILFDNIDDAVAARLGKNKNEWATGISKQKNKFIDA